MKLEVRGIDHINLYVQDLEKTCQFWKALLGFDTLEEIPNKNGRIIGNQKALLALYEKPDFLPNPKTHLNHISFTIKNFQDIENKCHSMNIEIKYGGALEWKNSRSIYINDPNGYEIEFSENWGGGLV